MEIIRYAELKAHPWRNGGGVTRELASHPRARLPGRTHETARWDWRVSIAEVSKAGDFSAFPGMDRVLTVMEGELLLLSVDGAEHPLEKYRPFRFSGDADCGRGAAHGRHPRPQRHHPQRRVQGLHVHHRTLQEAGASRVRGPARHPAAGPGDGQPRHRRRPTSTGRREPAGSAAGAAGTRPSRRRWPAMTPSSAPIPAPRKSWAAASWPSCRSTAVGRISPPSAFTRVPPMPTESSDSRCASQIGTIETTIRTTATTLTTGAWLGRKRFCRIQIGRVVSPAPMVNVVTMISSKLSAKASSPPASRAERSCGNVTSRNVVNTPAPRSADASSRPAAASGAAAQ